MDCSSIQNTFLIILLVLLVGQGDGRWKKSNREMLQHNIKLFKKMTEKIKQELGEYYEEFSEEPFEDYFFEEIDYMQSKIERNMKKKARPYDSKEINYSHYDNSNSFKRQSELFTKNSLQGIKAVINNVTLESERNTKWPSFEDILTEMGKKYDWKNDRWIKIKSKIKDKIKTRPNMPKNNVEHLKHNFRYRVVKLNRAKSKRNIVVAVTAVR